jgi:hypothetical protein
MAAWSKSRQPTRGERQILCLVPWGRGRCALHSLSLRVLFIQNRYVQVVPLF